jgi:hypothetical protein
MAPKMFSVFTAEQKQNIAIYIIGIMLYKFGLEYFNGILVRIGDSYLQYTDLATQVPSSLWPTSGSVTSDTRRSAYSQALTLLHNVLALS